MRIIEIHQNHFQMPVPESMNNILQRLVTDIIKGESCYREDQKPYCAEKSALLLTRREIDAQKYLIAVAEKYKIPAEETEVTRKNLANYEAMLECAIWRKKSGRNEQ